MLQETLSDTLRVKSRPCDSWPSHIKVSTARVLITDWSISVNLRERLLDLMTGGKAEQAWNYISHKSGSSHLLGETPGGIWAWDFLPNHGWVPRTNCPLSRTPSRWDKPFSTVPTRLVSTTKITLQRETGMFMMLWACISVTWLCVTGPVWEPSPELVEIIIEPVSPDSSCLSSSSPLQPRLHERAHVSVFITATHTHRATGKILRKRN